MESPIKEGSNQIDEIIESSYSETCLKRTPTGPKFFVRFNQVSAL